MVVSVVLLLIAVSSVCLGVLVTRDANIQSTSYSYTYMWVGQGPSAHVYVPMFVCVFVCVHACQPVHRVSHGVLQCTPSGPP